MGKKHGGHHGGAWKVAYADFVTAMMALFMVLWISAQDQEILISTSKYFQNPFDSPLDRTNGVMSGDGSSSASFGQGENEPTNLIDMALMHSISNEFYRLLEVEEATAEKPVDIKITSDGLRVTVFDRRKRPLFVEGTADLTEWGEMVVQNLAWLMDRYEFKMRIDSHSTPEFQGMTEDYGPWELSGDRGAAMRSSLIHFALSPRRIQQVTSYGDSKPLPGRNPDDSSNQRVEISLLMRND